jgi:hypothetical protein
MAKVNKIVQYDLGGEVMDLKNKGLSQADIATQLKFNHRDIKDLENLSAMSVNRFLTGSEVDKYEKQLIDGESPEDALRAEFREKMYEIDDEVHQALADSKSLRAEANIILEKAKQSDDLQTQMYALKSVSEALKQYNNSIEQTRRNWSTFVEQAFRQFGAFQEAKQNVNIQYNTLLIDISKDLCSECRNKVVKDILKFEEDNKEI